LHDFLYYFRPASGGTLFLAFFAATRHYYGVGGLVLVIPSNLEESFLPLAKLLSNNTTAL
jgi:hypothetical protein